MERINNLMKNTLLHLIVLLGFSISIYAQNDVKARIEFEEAEKAFEKNDHKTSLQRLNEAEKLLGKTNTKILYIKILNQNQIVQASPYDEFTILKNLRNDCEVYLKLIENKSELYDKYKEVYIIVDQLKLLPTTLKEWNEKKDNFNIESKPLEIRKNLGQKILADAANAIANKEIISSIKDVQINSVMTVNGEKIEVIQKFILPNNYFESLLLNGINIRSRILKNNKLIISELGEKSRTGNIKELEDITETASFFTEKYILNSEKYSIYAKNNIVVDGLEMLVLEVIYPDKTNFIFTYNSETKLLYSVTTSNKSSKFLEYKDYSGIKIPTLSIHKEDMNEYKLEVKSVEFNKEINISEFK